MTLTQVAIITRKGIIAVIALIFLGIVGAIGYRIWYDYYISTLPPVEEKPDFKFGVLPKINFPKAVVSSSNYSYSIDTESGSLPQMPKTTKVYFIPRTSTVSLLAPDESQKLAEQFGFNQGKEVITPFTYKYFNSSGGFFIIDLTTGNFNYQQKIATPSAKPDQNFKNQTALAANFKEFLKNNGLLKDELISGRTNVIYATASAKVSAWPSDFDNLKIVTSSFNTGLIKTNAINTEIEQNRYPEMNYVFWQIDKNTYSTYPLKPIDKAFAELQSGNGFVAQESKTSKVSITQVYLAYFETEEYSPYLQPVYVFEGPSFIALVPAISQN